MNADELLSLLATRHREDVFVSECKTGPTWGSYGCVSHRRLDAWAMKKSYLSPCIYGYEIKVSRNDFTSDDKWREYLPFCNEFYFVCPYGLIQKDELDDGVGLICGSKTGSRLFTKRRAKHRAIDPPVSLFTYILFSRSHVVPPYTPYEESNIEYWTKWLEDKRRYKITGSRVSKKIADAFMELRVENLELIAELEKRGITWGG